MTTVTLSDGHTTLDEASQTATEMHELAESLADDCNDTDAAVMSKGAAMMEMLVAYISKPSVRVCADSEDGQHVLKQDGPFSVVYCDACGMNKGHRTDG